MKKKFYYKFLSDKIMDSFLISFKEWAIIVIKFQSNN